MKKFEWRYTKRPGDVDKVASLLEVIEGETAQFWGILKKNDDETYTPILLNKYRNGYLSVTDHLDMADAKLAAERKLLDFPG